jgi:catechol 2,3-dioxygenase-like lactoylglutathione lyase family enzyme
MAASNEIIKPKLHHWGMRTIKFDEMVAWYGTVVGFEPVLSSESPMKSQFVTNDEQHHRGGFFNFPHLNDDPGRFQAPGINHLAWDYESLDDLLATWQRLKDEGIEPLITTDHGPTFAFYYKDPENNTVELLCDAYGDAGKSMEHMLRPDMIQNPMGTPVDPALLIEARANGMSVEEVHERAQAGEFAPDGPPPDPRVLA